MRSIFIGRDERQLLPLIKPLPHLLLQLKPAGKVQREGERSALPIPAGSARELLHGGDGEVLVIEDELEVKIGGVGERWGEEEVVGEVREEGAGEVGREAEVPAEAVEEGEGETAAGTEHEKAEEAGGGVREGGREGAELLGVDREECGGSGDEWGWRRWGRRVGFEEGGGEKADEADWAEGEAKGGGAGCDGGEGE